MPRGRSLHSSDIIFLPKPRLRHVATRLTVVRSTERVAIEDKEQMRGGAHALVYVPKVHEHEDLSEY